MKKVEQTIEKLSSVEGRTSNESKRLANAIFKQKSRSISTIYEWLSKELKTNEDTLLKLVIIETQGKKTLPSFKAFMEKAPQVEYWTVWKALGVLKQFNKKAKAKDKAIAQQRREDAKTMEIAKPEESEDILDKLMDLVDDKATVEEVKKELEVAA